MERNFPLSKITSVMLVLTHECNLRCRYCFVEKKPERMSFDVALAAAKMLIANAEECGKVPHINYFGGEPLLMWDDIIVPLTKWIRDEYRKPFTLGITTNGTLLDDERIQFIRSNQISLLFSIDGNKQTQDYNRPYCNGDGSFDSLQEIIPKISCNFPYVTFRGTIIPQTCHHTFDNIMFARDQGFRKFYVVPNVFENWSTTHKEILKAEMNKYADYYINEYRRGKYPIKFATFDDAFLDIKKINYAIAYEQDRSLDQCCACGKCGLGASQYASIHPNGNIYSCQEMTSNVGTDSIFYIGNVDSGVIDARRRDLMDKFDSERAVGLNCDTCRYNRICNGGCVANNYLFSGTLHKNPPMSCWWQQTILEIAIRVMQTLGEDQNVQFLKQWSSKHE